MTRYQRPARPRTPDWLAAMDWWRDLGQRRRLELRQSMGLRSCGAIVEYHARGGR